jgi:hypothetical protein
MDQKYELECRTRIRTSECGSLVGIFRNQHNVLSVITDIAVVPHEQSGIYQGNMAWYVFRSWC